MEMFFFTYNVPLLVAGCNVAKTELYLRYSQLFHITHSSVRMSSVSHSPSSLEKNTH